MPPRSERDRGRVVMRRQKWIGHEVGLLMRAARTRRDRIMIEVTYAGGLRVSELVA
jgi:site-specific recombinase XerC